MTIENIIPIATSIGGGFFIGILLGYFVKKVIKVIMFITGGIVALLLFLQYNQIISVNMDRLQDSSTSILNSVAFSFDKMAQMGDAISLGIPITASLTAGFTVGFMRS